MRAYKFVFPIAVVVWSCSFGCSSSDSGGTTPATHPVGTGATVTKSAGPEGGTVALDDGTTLEVPAGALDSSQSITITSSMDAPPSGVTNLSPIYKFGPEGLTFKIPVTVHLPF